MLAQGGQKRDPRLSDVPTIWELMDKHKTDEATKGLAKVLLAPDDLGRPLFGPPGIPADRVKVLREGFIRMMNDPDVLAEAQKKGLEPNPISGDEIEGLVKELRSAAGSYPANENISPELGEVAPALARSHNVMNLIRRFDALAERRVL